MTLSNAFSRAAALAALCLGAAVVQAQAPADLDAKSLARLPYVQRKDTDEGAKRLFDIFVRNSNRPTDALTGPLAFASYNVPVATALLDLHDGAVGKGTLNAHVRELAIMVACRETNYNLEWNGHEATALRSGVDAKVIDVIRKGGALTGIAEADATVIRFGRQLFTDRKVDSATFAKAVELFGQNGVMNIVAVMNTYAVSGFYVIAVDQHMPAGQPTLPPAH